MHVEKYTKNGLGNLFAHYERKDYETRNFANESIDKSRTELNYNLAPVHREGQYKFTKNRCEALHILKRDNVNWCASWCITATQEIKDDPEKCKAFFQSAYDFLSNRYGVENVISAYVHMDETTPHMHFAFLPISKTIKMEFDKETAELQSRLIEKVSCKEVINKAELSKIHKDMQEHMDKELEFKVSVMNGETAHGNKNIKELKQLERLKAQNQMLEHTQQVMLDNIKKLIKCNHDLEAKSKKIKELVQNLFETSEFQISELQRKVEILDNKYYDIEKSFKGFDSIIEQNKELEQSVPDILQKELTKECDNELDFA